MIMNGLMEPITTSSEQIMIKKKGGHQMNILLLIVIFILQICFGITMSGYGRNKGVKQAVNALQKILEEREEVTIKLSDGRIKTFKATSVK